MDYAIYDDRTQTVLRMTLTFKQHEWIALRDFRCAKLLFRIE